MSNRRLRQGAIATVAFVLLGILFVLSRPSDPDAHAGMVDILRGIRESEETLGRLVLQIGARRLLTYDPIVAAERALERALATVRSHPAMQEPAQRALVDNYAAVVKERRVALDRFKSSDAIHRNSSLYLPLLLHDVARRARNAAQLDLANAIADWDQALFLRLHGRQSEADFASTTRQLRLLADDRPEVAQDLDLLVMHAQLLVREQDVGQALISRILELSRGDLPARLHREYMERHVVAERRAGRVLYALYAAAVLCVVGLLIMVGKLDRATERLASANQSLHERAIELQHLSNDLEREVKNRRIVQAELQRRSDTLERNVAARTAALVASEARLVDAIETLPEAFVWFDAQDRLVVCNAAYRALSAVTERHARQGVTFEELVRMAAGEGMYTIEGVETEVWVRRRLAQFRAVGREPVRSEHRRADGRWIELVERRTRDGGLVGLRIDVTESRRRDAITAESNKLAALGQLAGGVAHELNNLLQPALTFPELVRDRLPPEDIESREDLDLVLESVRTAREIVQNILLFARKKDAKLENVDLAMELGSALKLVRDLLPPGISLRHHVDVTQALSAVNKTQLTQVLTNLVVNAAHATGDHGSISVTLSVARPSTSQADQLGIDADTDYLTLAVADAGTGMDATTLARIFEPFFTTKPLGQGTGLGLSVVFGILRSWKGAIAVDSELGRGTTFTLYIPALAPVRSSEAGVQAAA